VDHTACGGATLAYAAKGDLALAVLSPDANTNGGFGYWNESVGFATQDGLNASGAQDFTVFQVSGQTTGQGGQFAHGDYVVMYTPGGKLADDTVLGGTGSQTAYCLSVQDVYRTVRGVPNQQRWPTVLRPCSSYAGGPLERGTPEFVKPNGSVPGSVINADPYQLWSPVQVSGSYLEFQNVGLNNSSYYRHNFGGFNFVLDDTANGGSGTQALAFPENDQLNQKDRIIGCSLPITVFNQVYYTCPNGAPNPVVTSTPVS
jgi:hypothetical protein